jgi:hypothetical protein
VKTVSEIDALKIPAGGGGGRDRAVSGQII